MIATVRSGLRNAVYPIQAFYLAEAFRCLCVIFKCVLEIVRRAVEEAASHVPIYTQQALEDGTLLATGFC